MASQALIPGNVSSTSSTPPLSADSSRPFDHSASASFAPSILPLFDSSPCYPEQINSGTLSTTFDVSCASSSDAIPVPSARTDNASITLASVAPPSQPNLDHAPTVNSTSAPMAPSTQPDNGQAPCPTLPTVPFLGTVQGCTFGTWAYSLESPIALEASPSLSCLLL
jgi:hypothetical protein